MEESQAALVKCSFCGMPPRADATGKSIPLKRCGRCRKERYHDAECQRKHYSVHKQSCKKAPTTTNAERKDIGPSLPSRLFREEKRPDRGTCLVATKEIAPFTRLKPQGDAESWQPLVPPVLSESFRSARCALCFGAIRGSAYVFPDIQCQRYGMHFCSSECREKAELDHYFKMELASVAFLYSRPGPAPPKIFPTAILLYRILVAIRMETTLNKNNEKVENQLKSFQYMQTNSIDPNSSESHHQRAVIATVHSMLEAFSFTISEDFRKKHLNIQNINQILSQIKLNSFTVVDAESVPLGFGLFPTLNRMNHSCVPNAVQTFELGLRQSPPKLVVTTCTTVSPGDELRISYIDIEQPMEHRRRELRSSYSFDCDCALCTNDSDSQWIAFRCLSCSNHDLSVRSTSDFDLECSQCGNVSFASSLKALEEKFFSTEVATIESLADRFETMRQFFHPSSCYVVSSGEQLLEALLEQLGSASNGDEQVSIATKAIDVVNTLVEAHRKQELLFGVCQSTRLGDLLFKSSRLRTFSGYKLNVAVDHEREGLKLLSQVFVPSMVTEYQRRAVS